jgi:hypothetical protein
VTPKRNALPFFTVVCVLCFMLAFESASAQTQPRTNPSGFRATSGGNGHYSLLSMQISPGTATLTSGQTSQLAATGKGTDNNMHTVTSHVTWSSSSTAVATVTSAGLVTAVGLGSATITASRGGVQSTSKITVSQKNSSGPVVPASLFSMSFHSRTDWPTVTINSVRLWDTGTYWATMNTSDGVYDFHVLDNWTAAAQSNGVDLIYTFGMVPTWASSQPSLICGTGVNFNAGSCAPPDDLNADGTGTNQHWKDFVTALVTHAAGSIKYYELWNEPTITSYWQGNDAQLVRMASDAYGIIKSIDPTAQVTTPSPSTGINGVANWMGPYLAAGGGQYADIVSFHGYSWSQNPGVYPQPEDIVGIVDNLKVQTALYGQSNKPLWCTEGSWGGTTGNGFTDPDLHAAYVARHYLLQNSEGVVRYYWYAYDNGTWGGLWDSTSGLNTSGTAYQQVENWIVGATTGGQCVQNGTVWNCTYTRSGGYAAEAIWDTSQTCSNGSCTTSTQSVGSQYLHYLDLTGISHNVVGASVPVGAKPILLQNQ